jgi:hypothetical protein
MSGVLPTGAKNLLGNADPWTAEEAGNLLIGAARGTGHPFIVGQLVLPHMEAVVQPPLLVYARLPPVPVHLALNSGKMALNLVDLVQRQVGGFSPRRTLICLAKR